MADKWTANTDIIGGLGNVGDDSAPTVFTLDGDLYLIAGENNGNFNGFKWNTTDEDWDSNADIVGGLGDVGNYSAPTVFTLDSDLYLISGETSGRFNGFKWNTTTEEWDSNADIVSGLTDIGDNSAQAVFYLGDDLYLISGEYSGHFTGFKWNTTDEEWYSNSYIVGGLGDIGGESRPTVFIFDGYLYLISGEDDGNFNGWKGEAVTVPTNTQVNIGDSWKDASKIQINIGDSWKDVTKVQVNVGDSWKTIF